MAPSRNSLVATLIANPSRPVLTDEIVASAAASLGQETERSVLARGIAADLIVPAPAEAKAVEASLRQALAASPSTSWCNRWRPGASACSWRTWIPP